MHFIAGAQEKEENKLKHSQQVIKIQCEISVKKKYSKMQFPYSAIEEQHEIVNDIKKRLSVATKMEESITQSPLQAETLMQSILKKAFEEDWCNE